jgi:ferredoxin-type protein NapH
LKYLESILVARRLYLPVLIAMLAPVVLAMLIGSVFCSWFCPISFFSEILDTLRRRLCGKKWLKDSSCLPGTFSGMFY